MSWVGYGGVSPEEGIVGRSVDLCASVSSPIKFGWMTTVPGLLHPGLLNMSTQGCAQHCCSQPVPGTEAAV